MNDVINRKRGAQPGNQNARKHGFYSCVLDDSQKRSLKQAVSVEGLDEEIGILRLKLKSVLKNDPENVRLFALAAISLTRMLRAKYLLSKGDKTGQLQKAIGNVIREIAVPLGVDVTKMMIR